MSGYDAFISYRRSDGRHVARWLRRELESFKAPRSMPAFRGRALKVYLDTSYETGTIDFYERNVRPALLASRYFIVIATPDALRRNPRQDWILRELNDFADGPNGANVLAVRGAGDLIGPLPGDLHIQHPNIEIIDLRGIGWLAFLNPLRASRLSQEKLKIVAPLLGVTADLMPALRLEDERRQQMKVGAALGATAAVVGLTAGASVFAFRSLWMAQEALESSIFSTEHMITAIADNLPEETDPYGTRGSLLNAACDLNSKLARQAEKTPAIREHVLCLIERARARSGLREHDQAIVTVEAAVSIAREGVESANTATNGIALMDARRALVELLAAADHTERARVAAGELATDAQRLSLQHPETLAFPIAEARSYLLQRDLLKGADNARARVQLVIRAADRLDEAVRHAASRPDATTRIAEWQAELLAQSGAQFWELREFATAAQQLRKAVAVRARLAWPPHEAAQRAGNELAIVDLLIAISALERETGDVVAARATKAQSVTRLAQVSIPPDDAQLAQRHNEIKHKLEQLVL